MATIANRDWARVRNAVLRVEGASGSIGAGQTPPVFGASWPFSTSFDFGISIAGVKVTVGPGLVYRAGYAYETTSTEITLTSSYLWIAIQLTPSAIAGADIVEVVRYDFAGLPMDHDGLVVRGLHKFTYVSGTSPYVDWARSCLGFDTGMMGY